METGLQSSSHLSEALDTIRWALGQGLSPFDQDNNGYTPRSIAWRGCSENPGPAETILEEAEKAAR